MTAKRKTPVAVSSSALDGRKKVWAKAGLRTDQINFLAALLQTSDELAAYQASTSDRKSVTGTPLRKGANAMLLELYRHHAELLEGVRQETTRLARLKMELGFNAMLDAEDPEDRAAALTANLRRFSSDDAGQPDADPDRDPLPIVHAAVDIEAAIRERARG